MKSKTLSLISAATASLALLIVAAPATAKPAAYVGETEAGTEVSFTRTGSAVSKLRTEVPVYCVSTRTSDTRSAAEGFEPVGRIKIGGEQASQAEQPVSVGMGDTATKHYKVTLKRGRRGALSGELSVSFMAIEPYFNSMGYLDGNTFVCQGSTKFKARPR